MLKFFLKKVNLKCLIKCKALQPISKTSDSVHSLKHNWSVDNMTVSSSPVNFCYLSKVRLCSAHKQYIDTFTTINIFSMFL